MNLPNIKDARRRSKDKVNVYYDKYNIPESIEKIGKEKTYALLTYGCQMNVHDSENISGIMEELMYTKVEEHMFFLCLFLQCFLAHYIYHNRHLLYLYFYVSHLLYLVNSYYFTSFFYLFKLLIFDTI